MITGNLDLPLMTGQELEPGITIMSEPMTVNGQLRCLANVKGQLCVISLKLNFQEEK